RFVNHFAGLDADDVHAQHAIGLRICENLHKAVRGLVDLGAAIGRKGEFADGIGMPCLLQLFLGLADGGYLGRGIHNTWDHVVVHMTSLARDHLGAGNALVLRLVGQHGTGDHVADGIDALHVGREMRINLHAAAVIERDARLLKPEALGIGHAADADENDIGFDHFLRAARSGLDLGRKHLARINRRDLGAELELESLLLEYALELPRDLAIHAGQDAIEKFDHGDLGAEPVPDRAELEPDHARADNQELAGDLVQRQRAGRRHDALLIDFDALQPCNVRAGGDHDVLGLDELRLAIRARDFDLAGTENLALAVNDVDLVLLHQELDALDVAVDALLLEVHHGRQIELGRRDADAHLGKGVSGLLEHLRGMQQRLRGHAADIEAGAAQRRILLDHGDLHAELR